MKQTILCIIFLIHIVSSITAQWEQTNGPYSTTCRSYISLNADTVLMGGGGVYYKTIVGDGWLPFNNGISNSTYVEAFTKQESVVFMAGDSFVYKLLSPNNLWVPSNNGLPERIRHLAANSSKIFAATYTEVYVSDDSGENWSLFSSELPTDKNINTLAIKGSMIYAGTYGHGVYASNINSANWVEKNWGLGSLRISEIVVSNDILYLGVPGDLGSYGVGLFKSIDDGNNWTLVTDIGGGVSELEVLDNIVCFGTNSEGVFYSSDYGESWEQVNSGLPSNNIWTLHMSNSSIFSGSYSHGSYISEIPPVSWKQNNVGLPLVNNYTIESTASSLISATRKGVFRYNSLEINNWIYEKFSGYSINQIDYANNNIFIGVSGGTYGYFGVYRSVDAGASWEHVAGSGFDAVEAMSANSDNVVACEMGEFNNGSISLSIDGGDTWNDITNDLPLDYNITSLFVVDTIIFAALEDGIYFSDNFGVNWELRNTGIPISAYSNSFIEYNELIFTCTSKGVFVTDDYGINWLSANNGLTYKETICFTKNDTSIFVGTSGGIFKSNDSGENWKDFSEGFPANLKTESLTIYEDQLFAATWSKGIWKRPLSGPNSIKVNTKETLSVNVFPNPANSTITIKNNLVQEEYIVEIISLSGEVIKGYEFISTVEVINISDLRDGLYLIKFVSSKGSVVKKLVKR